MAYAKVTEDYNIFCCCPTDNIYHQSYAPKTVFVEPPCMWYEFLKIGLIISSGVANNLVNIRNFTHFNYKELLINGVSGIGVNALFIIWGAAVISAINKRNCLYRPTVEEQLLLNTERPTACQQGFVKIEKIIMVMATINIIVQSSLMTGAFMKN